jgi:hypothetical protein
MMDRSSCGDIRRRARRVPGGRRGGDEKDDDDGRRWRRTTHRRRWAHDDEGCDGRESTSDESKGDSSASSRSNGGSDGDEAGRRTTSLLRGIIIGISTAPFRVSGDVQNTVFSVTVYRSMSVYGSTIGVTILPIYCQTKLNTVNKPESSRCSFTLMASPRQYGGVPSNG